MFRTVLDTPLFAGIVPSDPEWVVSRFTERSVPKHQVLFYQGDLGTEMYVIKSGVFQIFLQENAHILIIGHQFPGETVGELELIHVDNQRVTSVSAAEDAVVWVIRKADLEDLLSQYPLLLRRITQVIGERLTQADRKISYLAFMDTRLRVANLLLDLYENFGVERENGYLIQWKITQQHFANMIGVNRESATRALQSFQDEGVVTLRNRQITITNLSKLQRIAAKEAGLQRRWHAPLKHRV
ncbi:Crp/Fnr family transcriptional regulator [Alicyclobacillus cycloheptanicus]|uniref:CRP/FNR family transcriptional regulator n=1 Tax=Alicyclobacillus cycloheptanicus TaxID=1457 RepID=A0ABT9XHU7_9BACL|nr:Crp/Fnr family transcriptional regulator [Alicyclobacillus cycloheptanicus]MDQ0189767.1 CRP/FNR family transcriptional regulator [Alicyclobacillus cycloheptanicus]WDM01971.1 Crp/Fnr family transcriptional regulator [Alicyclobacillus cycloheptanicus]